ncbi:transposase [Staphylococcus felis]|uniref:transposase n=1 Tax=Staphylococcus felis TaxID=46127 RepID=UPI0015F27920
MKDNNEACFVKIDINSVSPKLHTVVKILRKHNEMVGNTFEYNNLTNGSLEGINTNESSTLSWTNSMRIDIVKLRK